MSGIQEIRVPDIGGAKDVDVIEVLVNIGDRVEADESIITLETDKATMEIPSPNAGIVERILVKEGSKVSENSVIIELKSVDAIRENSVNIQPEYTAVEQASTAALAEDRYNIQEITVPDIGGASDVEVIEVLVAEGDSVDLEQPLITLETDKATMEIPAPASGIVARVMVQEGSKVSQGTVILELQSSAANVPGPAPAAAPEAFSGSDLPSVVELAVASSPPPVEVTKPEFQGSPARGNNMAYSSPSVRKIARELDVHLGDVKGTGIKGRITKEDVHAYVKAVMHQQRSDGGAVVAEAGPFKNMLPWPKVDFAKFGPVERMPLPRIRKISGANLHRNWVSIPHVTNHEDADITDLEEFRVKLNRENEKAGIKVTMVALLIKVAVAALKKFPDFNASLDGDEIVRKGYYHIGFAADTHNGLMVPVIRDADKKGILEVASEVSSLAAKARDGKLMAVDMSGGCFSISSLGGIGGTYFTPIINAPEVAILGVARSRTQLMWNGKEALPRLMLPMSLSWDHRVVDGAQAGRFNAYMADVLADFRRAML